MPARSINYLLDSNIIEYAMDSNISQPLTAYFLTANRHDFPAPFFTEKEWKRVDYKKKKKPNSIWICTLEVNSHRFLEGM